jgi:hypothetical protein
VDRTRVHPPRPNSGHLEEGVFHKQGILLVLIYPVFLPHSEHLEYMRFNSHPLTKKLEALDVVHAHIIVEFHDRIELLPLFSGNLVLAILGGEGVHFVEDRIALLLSDFWCIGSSHELREDDF